METNMSTADQVIRVIIAEILVALYLTQVVSAGTGIVFLVFSFAFLYSGVKGFCYLYAFLGFSTKEKKVGENQLTTGCQ